MQTQANTDTRSSVAVIGAGVVGLCTALQAQRKGYRVTLVDRGEPGKGASFGNAGYLATELIDPLSKPETIQRAPRMLLDPNGPLALPIRYLHRSLPWLLRFLAAAKPEQVEQSRRGLRQLNGEAIDAWKRTLQDVDGSDHLQKSGYLLVWESASRRREAAEHSRYLQSWGIESVLVEADRIAELEPALSTTVSHALFFPNAYQVRDPYLLCQHLFRVFEARGGRFVQQSIDSLNADARQVTLTGPKETLVCDKAIVCTGAWSKSLINMAGLDVPLEAERGYHLTLHGRTAMLNRPVGSAERHFVMSPVASGLRSVGFTEIGGLRAAPFERRFKTLLRHSQALIPELKRLSMKKSEWMGHRPTLPDSLPVISRHPAYSNLLFAFGNQHLGLTQAAITAEVVVSLLCGETPAIDPQPYRVDRFTKA
ncbi:amino acid dehydrogenase [Stutzerimonas stutzeri]|uniref:Amino acid dehydrogenase n=1 Tax=Stutzerimonas stutzeri TaxID=316 RepID=W8R754_STUST|nr:FAD-dependent oxidoreductase [Stutzerimonas stutzeri]AHL75413.1 amino acid dehydrogenase [Stutzerimonas stutzeri]MCQ4328025.1 FAD-binding oxidoreductase [Stutzerimonas stutzeri]